MKILFFMYIYEITCYILEILHVAGLEIDREDVELERYEWCDLDFYLYKKKRYVIWKQSWMKKMT